MQISRQADGPLSAPFWLNGRTFPMKKSRPRGCIYFAFLLMLCQNSLMGQKVDSLHTWKLQFDQYLLARNDALAESLFAKLSEGCFKAERYEEYVEVIAKNAIVIQRSENTTRALALMDAGLERLRSKMPKSQQAIAFGIHKKGVLFYNADRFEEAIEAFTVALNLRRKFLERGHIYLVKGLHNLGDCYWLSGRITEAAHYLDSSLQMHLTAAKIDQAQLALTYKVSGIVSNANNDFKMAEQHLFSALRLYEKIYCEEPWELAKIHIDLSIFFEQQEKPHLMIKHAGRAVDLYESIDQKYDDDYWGLANAFNNLGLAYEILDSFDLALSFLTTSLEINQRFALQRREKIAGNLNNIGLIRTQLNLFREAKSNFREAISYAEKERSHLLLAQIYNNLGELLEKQKEWKHALVAQETALTYVCQDPLSDDHKMVLDPVSFHKILASKARILNAMGLARQDSSILKKAIFAYDSLNATFDQLRQSYSSDYSKQVLGQTQKVQNEQAIKACLHLYRLTLDQRLIEKAWLYAQRSKSLILLDAVRDKRAKILSDIDPALLGKEQALRFSMTQVEQEIFNLNQYSNLPSEKMTALSQRWNQIQKDLENIIDTYELRYPTYYRLKYQVLDDLPLTQLQRSLGSEQRLLEYFVGEDSIYLFAIDQSTIRHFTQAKPPDFELKIQQLRSCIMKDFISLEDVQGSCLAHGPFKSLALELYQLLIHPVASMGAVTDYILVPDASLAHLPFDVLLTNEPTSDDITTWPFLIRSKLCSFQYSSNPVLLEQLSSDAQKKKILAFAPSFLAKTPPIKLRDLIHNEREVESVSSIISTDVYNAGTASKSMFLTKSQNYKLIHLSSHAQVVDCEPDKSFIAFSDCGAQTEEDMLLYLHDIYNLFIPAEMVVLSACETGIGSVQNGEGVASLARAFTYAGAQSLMTTLWEIDDQKSAHLMRTFYRGLAAGKSKHEALGAAKRNFLREGIDPHPYYWAGFVAYGNMQPISFLRASRSHWWISCILGGGLLVFGLGKIWDRLAA